MSELTFNGFNRDVLNLFNTNINNKDNNYNDNKTYDESYVKMWNRFSSDVFNYSTTCLRKERY